MNISQAVILIIIIIIIDPTCTLQIINASCKSFTLSPYYSPLFALIGGETRRLAISGLHVLRSDLDGGAEWVPNRPHGHLSPSTLSSCTRTRTTNHVVPMQTPVIRSGMLTRASSAGQCLAIRRHAVSSKLITRCPKAGSYPWVSQNHWLAAEAGTVVPILLAVDATKVHSFVALFVSDTLRLWRPCAFVQGVK